MLTDHVERYIALRQALGFKLRSVSGRLHVFARFATARGDSHIRASTVVDWAAQAPSPAPDPNSSFHRPATRMRP